MCKINQQDSQSLVQTKKSGKNRKGHIYNKIYNYIYIYIFISPQGSTYMYTQYRWIINKITTDTLDKKKLKKHLNT